jgi:HSP20 family molecular chaperone IbpA
MTPRNSLDVIFDDVTKALATMPTYKPQGYSQYTVDNGHVIEVPAVGAKKEDVSVDVENNNLVVKVTPSVNSKYAHSFERKWVVPANVDLESVTAKLEHGLLTVSVSKSKPPSKKVTVSVA